MLASSIYAMHTGGVCPQENREQFSLRAIMLFLSFMSIKDKEVSVQWLFDKLTVPIPPVPLLQVLLYRIIMLHILRATLCVLFLSFIMLCILFLSFIYIKDNKEAMLGFCEAESKCPQEAA